MGKQLVRQRNESRQKQQQQQQQQREQQQFSLQHCQQADERGAQFVVEEQYAGQPGSEDKRLRQVGARHRGQLGQVEGR